MVPAQGPKIGHVIGDMTPERRLLSDPNGPGRNQADLFLLAFLDDLLQLLLGDSLVCRAESDLGHSCITVKAITTTIKSIESEYPIFPQFAPKDREHHKCLLSRQLGCLRFS
jgi:hypothetical protein